MLFRLLILANFLIAGFGASAQTQTQMSWGIDKTVTPYAFGANINGTWYNLGTVSSAGAWTLNPTNVTVLGNLGVGTTTPVATFQITQEVGSYISGFYGKSYLDTGVKHYFTEIDNTNSQGYGEGYYTSYARGTYASPQNTQINDVLGYLGWGSYSSNTNDPYGFDYSTAIAAIVDSTPSQSYTPSAIIFYTQGISYNGTSTTPYEKMRISSAGNLGVGTTTPATLLTVAGPVSLNKPSTITAATYTVATTDSSLIFNTSATCTVTMPTAASYPGRILHIKTIAAFAVNSASSNIVPIATATAGTAILTNTAGKWAVLQSDGTNWVIMSAN